MEKKGRPDLPCDSELVKLTGLSHTLMKSSDRRSGEREVKGKGKVGRQGKDGGVD